MEDHDKDYVERYNETMKRVLSDETLSDDPLMSGYRSLYYLSIEMSKESDRGCGLVASHFIDAKLKEYLKRVLIGKDKFLEEIFDYNGPLGNFSSKTKMAYSLGLITKDEYKDINIIRTIRNDFGHSFNSVSFSDQKIKSKVCSLSTLDYEIYKDEPRNRFYTVVSGIIGRIEASIVNAVRFESPKEIKVMSLAEFNKASKVLSDSINNIKAD